MKLYIDGDGCNARARVLALRLTKRNIFVEIVSNMPIAVSGNDTYFSAVVVGREQDAVDSYVLRHIIAQDALITRDLLFAKQALALGAWVASDYGERYFIETIDARIVSARSRMDIREYRNTVAHEIQIQSRTKKAHQLRTRTQQLADFFYEWIRHHEKH